MTIEQLIEENIELIEQDTKASWITFYQIAARGGLTPKNISSLNQLLLRAEIDPVATLQSIPSRFLTYAHTITQYMIPINCKYIGDRAFASSALTSCIIPSSVESLGEEVFFNCIHLKKVVFNNGALTSIPIHTFQWCNNLRRLVLPNSLKEFNTDVVDNEQELTGNKLTIEYAGSKEDFYNILVLGKHLSNEFDVVCSDETFHINVEKEKNESR